MARLIDADALLKDSDKREGAYGLIFSAEDIRNAPTIEAEPVKYGCWNRSGKSPWVKCSWCGESFSVSNGNAKERFNYCPNCGADMRDE